MMITMTTFTKRQLRRDAMRPFVVLLAVVGVIAASPPAVVRRTATITTVSPSEMHGWVFYDDRLSAVCMTPAACRLVLGPSQPPMGFGSAELFDSTSADAKALLLPGYLGTHLSQFTSLRYDTYRQTADAGNNLAISLQFNLDYDLNDANTSYQGRLVFEPYLTAGGTVVQGAWQSWDALAGKWWGTRSSVVVNNATVPNPCLQSAPCTWGQLIAAFPNAGVHLTYGAVVLKAGSGWPGFRGNADHLTVGVDGSDVTYDFEPARSQDFGCLGADTTSDDFAWHFLSFVQRTVRDTSAYAAATRPVAALPFRPTSSVALVTDSATCVMLAMRFAQSVPGRILADGDKVYAVTIDSTHYAMTDLHGGTSPTVRQNPDGSRTIVQRPMVRDALTIDRSSGTKVQWLYDLFAYFP